MRSANADPKTMENTIGEEENATVTELKRCPVDHSWMANNENLDHVYQSCPKCQGLWLPGTELEAMFKEPLPGPGQLVRNSPGTTRCPDGHGPLNRMVLRGIELEQCSSCGGLWVPRKTLPALKPLLRNHARLKPPGWSLDEETQYRKQLPILWMNFIISTAFLIYLWWTDR